MNDLNLQETLIGLSKQSTARDAINFYEKNYDILKDWRYLYASENDTGPFKLKNMVINKTASIKSIFKGKSLIIIDSNAINKNKEVRYQCGVGTYFDSNTASYIRSLAYAERGINSIKSKLMQIEQLPIDYNNINPYLYLYETHRHYESKPETIKYSKQTFAAINALNKIGKPLDEEWHRLYHKYFREKSEAEIEILFNEFQSKLQDGLRDKLNFGFILIELLLIQTKILEISSSKPGGNKLEQLFQFMDSKIGILMIREIACCATILFHDKSTSLFNKLNGLHQKSNPIEQVQNCAWDLYLFRIMDELTNIQEKELYPSPDFYISYLVSCDRDIREIGKLSSLRGIALHTKSSFTQPFMENDPQEWLMQKIDTKRMHNLLNMFDYSSRIRRLNSANAQAEISTRIKILNDLAIEKRKELIFHLNRKNK